MADQKLFSIITAIYNPGEKIDRTLQSIFGQNKDLFELIVMDGGSTDDTLRRLDRYKHEFTLVSEKDAGVYDAFNKGIDLATGKYIYFIGAGDVLRPGVLEEVRKYLPEETPTLVYGKCYFVKSKRFDGRKFTSADFSWTNICHQGEFYHRSIFYIVGKYDLKYKVFADWMLNTKCFLSTEVENLYVPLHIADYEEGGLSSDLDNDPKFKKDFPRFIGKELGIRAYLKCKWKMRNPGSLYFTHGVGLPLLYDILKPIAPYTRPFVRGFRKLRNSAAK